MNEPSDERLGLGGEAYYQKAYGTRRPEHYLWLLAEIVRSGRPGNIIDLGCGPALFVEMASKWGMDAMGCDGSEDALRIARNRNPNLKLIHHLLSTSLPFEDGTIDNILLNQVIEHLPTRVLTNLLIDCRRVLRNGGMLFVYSPNKADKLAIREDPTHINPLYPSELRMLLSSSGFRIVEEPNSPRFFPRTAFLSSVTWYLTKTRFRDWISASSNAHARKVQL